MNQNHYFKYQTQKKFNNTNENGSSRLNQKFNKEPGTFSEVHFSNSQVGSSGQSRPSSPTPSLFRRKDYYQENKYVTDKINNYNQSKKQVLASSESSTSNSRSKIDNPSSGGHQNPGTSNDRISEPQYAPSIEDRALLKYALEMKFLSFDQVERKFLGNQQTAGSFRNLLAGGYIKSKDGASSPQSLIIPTEKAYELLKVENPDKDIPKPVKRVFDPAVNHDLKLVELRFRFEQLNFIKKWYSERALEEVPMMNRLFQDLPDACCKKNNDKSYFLELEISKKSPSVYEKRIKEYERILAAQEIAESGIEGVIFLCTDEKVHDIIKSKLPNSKSFSCMMLSRYLKEKESAA